MPSSVIKYFFYIKDREVLAIIYQSGTVYHYFGVPGQVYLDMRSALSKGSFLNQYIKGHYRYKRIL
ncbi:MAG: KTSC domain-containing protein [Taibaiella sp.]|nr:KTSC domain-containing protein [Taibaiella sp.]